jgi:hypothetical protein
MQTESNVDSYMTPLDAELAKAYLESHDIHVRLEGEELLGAAFALGPMLGGVQLFVDKGDGERASSLLAQYHALIRDEPETALETPGELVDRAWRSSLVGYVTIPVLVHLYSISLLLQVRSQSLSGQTRRRYVVAWLMDVLAIAFGGWAISRAFG